ncbi:MAG: hypothetical protein RSA40_01385 [Malacoplasma sp.]
MLDNFKTKSINIPSEKANTTNPNKENSHHWIKDKKHSKAVETTNTDEILSFKKNVFNPYNKWKEVQKKLQINKIKDLQAKKDSLAIFRDDYVNVIKNIERVSDNIKFNLSNLVKAVKYLNSSNSFFNNRLPVEAIDEILLLIFIYEWICLEKPKDQSILGTKEEVIKKFKLQTYSSNSEYKKIFENIDFDFDEGMVLFKDRLKNSTFKTYEKILAIIKDDENFFNKLNDEIAVNELNDKEEYFSKLWKDTFEILEDKYAFVYSVKNSDEKIICINIETASEVVATVKFKMFETHILNQGFLVANGISKELISLTQIGKKLELDFFIVMSHSYQIANRVVKNIFLQDLKLKIEDSKRVINIKPNILKNNIDSE